MEDLGAFRVKCTLMGSFTRTCVLVQDDKDQDDKRSGDSEDIATKIGKSER